MRGSARAAGARAQLNPMSLLNRGEAGDSGAGQGAALLLNKRQSWESDMDMVQSAKAEADRKAAERERKRLEREKVAAASTARRSVLRAGIVKMTCVCTTNTPPKTTKVTLTRRLLPPAAAALA